MTETNHCWHCGNPAAESLFCKFCNSLQRPTPDYYQFFGLPRRLSLDPDDLQKRFYSLSRQLHPDLFSRATPTDRQYSLEATAILNDAYRVLRDPVARAEYVLKEQGLQPAEQKPKDVPPELLEELFDLNMLIEELRSGDSSVGPQLEAAHRKFVSLRQEADAELERLFQQYDRTADPRLFTDIRGLLIRRRYIENLIQQVEKELAP